MAAQGAVRVSGEVLQGNGVAERRRGLSGECATAAMEAECTVQWARSNGRVGKKTMNLPPGPIYGQRAVTARVNCALPRGYREGAGSCAGKRMVARLVATRSATSWAAEWQPPNLGFPVLVSARIEGSEEVKLVKYLSAHARCSVGPADEGGVWSGPVLHRSGFRSPGRDSSPRASENLEARLC